MGRSRLAFLNDLAVIALLGSVLVVPDSSFAREFDQSDIGLPVRMTSHMPGSRVTQSVTFEIMNERSVGDWNAYVDGRKNDGYEVSLNGVIDPSIAYNLLATNPNAEASERSLNVDMPITPLIGSNTISAEITVEVMDTNNDGTASIIRKAPHAFPGFQRAFIFKNDGSPIFSPTWDVGLTDVTTPGPKTFTIEPTAGIVDPESDTLSFFLKFELSPGDTAHLMGRMIIDDGSGAPIAEILPLPSERPSPPLRAGDSDQDLDFDQFDLIKVQVSARYLTGQAATWGQGDWNGAPGGGVGNPPTGNGLFDQFDIIAAQQAGIYLTGSYAALLPNGQTADGQMSIVYDAGTGNVSVDAPVGTEVRLLRHSRRLPL